jgi:hypothetical protein
MTDFEWNNNERWMEVSAMAQRRNGKTTKRQNDKMACDYD